MGTGHAKGVVVALHQKAPGLGPFQNGKAPAMGLFNFRVGIGNGGGADDQSGIPQLLGAVADVNGDILAAEHGHGGGVIPVAALDGGAHLLKKAGQGPHGDAADAAEMNDFVLFDQLFQVLIVHMFSSYSPCPGQGWSIF